MLTLKRILFASLSLMLILGLGACFKMNQETTLMPDGSGKLVMKIGMKIDLSAMGGMMGGMGGPEGGKAADPLAEMEDPAELEKKFEGVECFLPPRKEKNGDWTVITLTAFFKDINRLKIKNEDQGMSMGGPGGAPAEPAAKVTSFEYTNTEGAYKLVVKDDSLGEMAKQGEQPEGMDEASAKMAKEMAKGMAQMMKGMLEGMEIRMAVKVPGAIAECKGFTGHNGNTAEVKVDDDMMVGAMAQDEEMMKKMKALGDEGTVSWKKHSISDEEVKAFQKEMEEAAKAWETYKKEFAEKKKAEAEKK